MAQIDKVITVTFTVKEASEIIKEYIKQNNGWDIDNVEFCIEPLTDDRGHYAGQEVEKIVCTGKFE